MEPVAKRLRLDPAHASSAEKTPGDAFSFSLTHLAMLKSLYTGPFGQNVSPSSSPSSPPLSATFALITEFVSERKEWAVAMGQTSIPFVIPNENSENSANHNKNSNNNINNISDAAAVSPPPAPSSPPPPPSPPVTTAVLALRRKYSLMKQNAIKPKSLGPLTVAISSILDTARAELASRAERYGQEVAEASAADLPPPLVYHDEELSLLSNRIMLWERLQKSVACISEL